ncbi:MAG: sensor of ECF-type sigma factor [Algibacter sp.]|uniref:sensor of ECF-type sigma factor n=1 Tax=Algibacter sp. TaxID=1872428 RepID=UPI00262696E2|nr:sensor of ECF-type sigma factor [Algibacter sp.]MDG1730305.1 sensor of ECF-type sigma factor [Algibacter sp.]MDG2178883.1 sensor of ECF-type sigma factor [Algibacter sp.]
MKKLLLITLLLFSLNITAQHKHRERIKALKVSLITKKLDLSEKEAQKFWPIYNAHEKEAFAIRFNEVKAIKKEIRDNMSSMTDEKAKELLDRLKKAEIKMHESRMEFANNLSGIISTKKIILLKMAEEDFKNKMLEEYKKRRKEKE